MRDRLLERRLTQGEVARLAPILDGAFVLPRLGEVVGNEFRFGLDQSVNFARNVSAIFR